MTSESVSVADIDAVAAFERVPAVPEADTEDAMSGTMNVAGAAGENVAAGGRSVGGGRAGRDASAA